MQRIQKTKLLNAAVYIACGLVLFGCAKSEDAAVPAASAAVEAARNVNQNRVAAYVHDIDSAREVVQAAKAAGRVDKDSMDASLALAEVQRPRVEACFLKRNVKTVNGDHACLDKVGFKRNG